MSYVPGWSAVDGLGTKRMSSQATLRIATTNMAFMAIEYISTQATLRVSNPNKAPVTILPELQGNTIHGVWLPARLNSYEATSSVSIACSGHGNNDGKLNFA